MKSNSKDRLPVAISDDKLPTDALHQIREEKKDEKIGSEVRSSNSNSGTKQPSAQHDLSKVDYNTLNLNKLDDVSLSTHKAAMDLDYQRNFIPKDSPDYKYDSRKDYSSKRADLSKLEDNSWDNSQPSER